MSLFKTEGTFLDKKFRADHPQWPWLLLVFVAAVITAIALKEAGHWFWAIMFVAGFMYWADTSEWIKSFKAQSAIASAEERKSEILSVDADPANVSGLIPCATCSNEIGVQAEHCPKCGSPNTWVHPRIQAFIDSEINLSRPMSYGHKGAVVWGESTYHSIPSQVGAVLILAVALLSGFFTLFVGPAIGGVIVVLFWRGTEQKDTFKADLISGSWGSSNDKFWRPVADVLGCKQPV